jgi:hypothetical protein
MALMLGIMVGGAILGAVGSGIEVQKSGCAMEEAICKNKLYLNELNSQMEDIDKLLKLENVELRQQIQNTAEQIAILNGQIKVQAQEFKKSYNNFQVGGILFIILIIFMLALKRYLINSRMINS